MNGWTPSTPLKTRLENLAAQIPQENRADAFAQCMQDNPHDLERFLTAYVMTRKDDAPHPVDEAQEIERGIDSVLPYPVIKKEVIDPTGAGWFCWESIEEIPF